MSPYDIDPTAGLLNFGGGTGGGLLGGSFYDPRVMGLFGLSQALLKAGQPSPYPVKTAQALGQGLFGGVQGAMQAQHAKLADDLTRAKLEEIKRKTAEEEQNRQIRARLFPGLVGGTEQGGAPAPAGALSTGPQGALYQGNDPERIEALGTYLALTGDAGAATLLGVADRIRTRNDERRSGEALKSRPGLLGAGVTATSPQGRGLLSNLTGDPAFDSAVMQAQNQALNSNSRLAPQGITAPNPGLFAPLMDSPYVGPYAKAAQQELDASPNPRPTDWLGRSDKLTQQHIASTNAATAREENANLRRELANQSDQTRRLVAGMTNASRGNREAAADRNFERNLANDYNRQSQSFQNVNRAFMPAVQYMQGGNFNSAGDQSLVYAFVKMNDPNDRVARGDLQDINKLGGIPERFRQWVVSVASGKELPERVRLEMLDAMRRHWEVENEKQTELEEEYERRAGQYMLAPDRVVRRHAQRRERAPGAAPGRNRLRFDSQGNLIP